jgi:hypothetical protein
MKLETTITKLLSHYPQGTEFSVIAYELWGNRRDGLEVNSLWYMRRNADLPTLLECARGRWEVFKVNYMPKARVSDLADAGSGYDDLASYIECDGVPFLEIRPTKPV